LDPLLRPARAAPRRGAGPASGPARPGGRGYGGDGGLVAPGRRNFGLNPGSPEGRRSVFASLLDAGILVQSGTAAGVRPGPAPGRLQPGPGPGILAGELAGPPHPPAQ